MHNFGNHGTLVSFPEGNQGLSGTLKPVRHDLIEVGWNYPLIFSPWGLCNFGVTLGYQQVAEN